MNHKTSNVGHVPTTTQAGSTGEATGDDGDAALTASTGFDLGRFRISQDFVATAGVKRLLTTVPVKKPHRQQWIYVRPGAEWCWTVGMIELKEDREHYLVDSALAPDLQEDWQPYLLAVYAAKGGTVALWPVRLPGRDGKDNDYWISARDAIQSHSGTWIQVRANLELGAYEISEAMADWSEPDWPAASLAELVEIAFAKKKRIIDSLDHVVLRKLRGEV